MSSTTAAAIERLETLQRQNPPTRLRSIFGTHGPIARTYPSQDTLLRYLSLPGSQNFLRISLPNNFVSWVAGLSSCFESMLAGQIEEDLPILYTAARFGQAQLCGQDDETLQHICAVMDNELLSSQRLKMAAWDDVNALSSISKEWTGFAWDKFIGFEYMKIDQTTITSSGKQKFDFRCSSCKRLGLCVCVFIDFLEQMEAMVRLGYCTRRAVGELTRLGSMDENETGAIGLRRECFCGRRNDHFQWTKIFTCTHAFHIICIGSWIMQHPKNYGSTTCPLCRSSFKYQEKAWVATDYMRYVQNCYQDLFWWKERLDFEKENVDLWIGSMRLDPRRDLRAAPYELLSPTARIPVQAASSKVIAVRAHRIGHDGSSSA